MVTIFHIHFQYLQMLLTVETPWMWYYYTDDINWNVTDLLLYLTNKMVINNK